MEWIMEIGTILINMLIRIKMPESEKDVFIDIVSALKKLGMNKFEARSIQRKFDNVADSISESCEKILEKSKMGDERKKIVVEHMVLALNNANLHVDDLLNVQSNEGKVKKLLLMSNTQYENDLDDYEKQIYNRLLEHVAHLAINAYIKMPEFTAEGIKRLNAKVDEIVEKIDEVLEQLEKIYELVEDKGKKVSDFERQYRSNVSSQNNYVYLFGAGNLSNEYKRYQLSIAYVELEIVDEESGKDIKIEKMFKKSKNVWLSGDAGVGKTTFLQWLAVQTAEGNKEILGLKDCIPLLIHLRKYDCKKLSLKDCINAVMKDSSYHIPEGWIEETKEAGKFLFLIDGFDEISQEDRYEVLEWLDTIDAKKKCKKVFTARPQVKERPKVTDLLEAKIIPMNPIQINKFILYWHKAVLDDRLKVDTEDSLKIANELYEKVCMTESVSRLAAVPLLCAMICALHYRNGMNMPTNKRELYEECCKMLIENRDIERGIVHGNIKLRYEQKKIILAQLAYWMMRNNYIEISFTDAETTVGRSISGMNFTASNKKEEVVFKYLLERCGILREPEIGKVDFLHRSFQEYLAAYEIGRQADWGVIKEKIGDEVWQETIGISLGYATKQIATDIVNCTLEIGKIKKEEKKYLFIAIDYLNGALEVEKELRDYVEQKAIELIPPKPEDCMELAKAGDLIVKWLECKESYTVEERIVCLRLLRMIGTVKALESMKTYFKKELTELELIEIGEMISQFTKKQLMDCGMHYILVDYVKNICINHIVIHNEMLRILNYMENVELNDIIAGINRLKIIEYDNWICLKKEIAFDQVDELVLVGDFEEANILNNFSSLKNFRIYNESGAFSIYSLNKYINLYKLEEFSIIYNNREYINGKDLEYLDACKKLEIILMDNDSEISFERFDLLRKVKELSVGADFILDIDFSELPNNIERLTVYAPEVFIRYAVQEINTTISETKIKVLEDYLGEIACWRELL